jgi:hypothetical protein
MKTFIGAIALIIAAPVAAQTAPSAQMDHSKMDHSQMGQIDHSQHSQGKHDCKECCEKMKGKDGKMECMDKKADAKTAAPDASAQAHEGHAH